MKISELEKLVNRILSGKQLIEHNDTIYELRNPDIDLKLQSNLLYDQEYNNLLYSDSFILEDNIDDLLIDLNILYPEYKTDLKSIETKIENLKVDIYKFFFDRTKRSKYKTQIANERKRYNELYVLSHSLDFLTLENYCANIKNEFLIAHTVYYYNTNNLVFIDSIFDYTLFNNITQKISQNIIDISVLKEIARSDYWRNYYAINKNHLLPYSIVDFSEEQKGILSISLMYDRIYEHPDCPDKTIIEDDDALEGWMIHQQRENNKQKQEKGVSSILESDSMRRASEVFLMANSRTQRDDIIGLNSQESELKRSSKISTVLQSQGQIADSQLPDVKQDIREKLKELNFSKK